MRTLLLLGLFLITIPAWADPTPAEAGKQAALAAMGPWLKLVDQGDAVQSWKQAAHSFHGKVSEKEWAAQLGQVRDAAGAIKERRLLKAVYQVDLIQPNGKVIHGHFVGAQFIASFQNFSGAMEKVTFEQESDGQWRAAGYFIQSQP